MVTTHLKNISQNGNLPQIGMEIKNIWNHHLVIFDIYVKFFGVYRVTLNYHIAPRP